MSARGLFKAAGGVAKPVATRDQITGEIKKVDHLEREADDFYPTPPEPIRALLKAEESRLRDFSTVWEPASGDGAMVRDIKEAGYEVHHSDLIDRGAGSQIQSFYDFKAPLADAIVTNPPFQECNSGAWIKHAFEVLGVEYMALLLPVNWMGSGKLRAALWEKHTPARIYLMRWRIDFTGQGAPPMLNAWYIWDTCWLGETALRMLDKSAGLQMEMFSA